MKTTEPKDQTLPGIIGRELVVDVDRHVQETWSVFEDYAEPQFRDQVYKRAKLPDGSEGIAIANRIMPGWSTAMWNDAGANKFFEDDRFWPNNPNIKNHDANSYVDDMDVD